MEKNLSTSTNRALIHPVPLWLSKLQVSTTETSQRNSSSYCSYIRGQLMGGREPRGGGAVWGLEMGGLHPWNGGEPAPSGEAHRNPRGTPEEPPTSVASRFTGMSSASPSESSHRAAGLVSIHLLRKTGSTWLYAHRFVPPEEALNPSVGLQLRRLDLWNVSSVLRKKL